LIKIQDKKYRTKVLHSPNNTKYKFSNVPKDCECPSSLSLYHNRCQGEDLKHKKTYDMIIYVGLPFLLEDTSLLEPSCHLPEVIIPDI